MEIKDGGKLTDLIGKLESIAVAPSDDYKFDLWLNGDHVSYLTLEEMLRLRDLFNEAIRESISNK
jgi:hypothetical protein